MVMFLLIFVKGVQIRGGESISASGYGPRGSKSAGTPALNEDMNCCAWDLGSGMWLLEHILGEFVVLMVLILVTRWEEHRYA